MIMCKNGHEDDEDDESFTQFYEAMPKLYSNKLILTNLLNCTFLQNNQLVSLLFILNSHKPGPGQTNAGFRLAAT